MLTTVMTEINEKRDGCIDIIIPLTMALFELHEGRPALTFIFDDVPRTMLLEDTAFGQLAEQMGIPQKYAQKMLAQPGAEVLLIENFAYWMAQTKDSRWMLRLAPAPEGAPDAYVIRAFVTAKYCRLDNENVVEQLQTALDNPECSAHGKVYLSDAVITRDYMRLVFDQAEIDTVEVAGEKVALGVIVRNNEIGEGAVVLQPYLRIENPKMSLGMPVNLKVYRRQHQGPVAFGSGTEEDIFMCPPPDKVKFALGKAIDTALSNAVLTSVCERIRAASECALSIEATDEIFDRAGVSKAERELLSKTWGGAPVTNWDLVMQLAHVASVATGSKQDTFETWAWNILTGGPIKAKPKKVADEPLFDELKVA